MFGIYCIALNTLSPHDCEAMFGMFRETLSTRFRFGCQQALLNCRFLRSAELECLTAFYLYLVSRDSLWFFPGVRYANIVRVALSGQNM